MVSYPIFWDQPSLAARCESFGLAVPLGCGPPRRPITADDVDTALDALDARRPETAETLARARTWEERAILERTAVLDRIEALM